MFIMRSSVIFVQQFESRVKSIGGEIIHRRESYWSRESERAREREREGGGREGGREDICFDIGRQKISLEEIESPGIWSNYRCSKRKIRGTSSYTSSDPTKACG